MEALVPVSSITVSTTVLVIIKINLVGATFLPL